MFFRVQTVNMGVPGEENWIFDTYLELRSYPMSRFCQGKLVYFFGMQRKLYNEKDRLKTVY